MSSGPELFVVCKKCNSEVSPYITECPYCGTRLRKRAPKLDKGGVPKASRRRERPKLSRLRPGEIPGVRADRRPYATIFLVLASILVTLFFQVRALNVINYLDDVVATSPLNGDYWKLVTQLFVYWPSTAYEVAALAAIFLFGWLLERRHGAWAPLLVFFVGGVAGSAGRPRARPARRHDGRQLGRAGAAGGVVDARHPGPPARRGGRRRPARRAGDRDRARAAAGGLDRSRTRWPG